MPNPCDLLITNVAIRNPLNGCGISGGSQLITNSIVILLMAASFISFTMLLWGGIQYITSGGNKEQLHRARGKITYALIGLVISFLAIFVWRILASILGFENVGN